MSSSAANDHEELVSQFMAITGSSDASTARTYLEMSGTNLEMAIGLFLEHTGGSGGGGTTATTTTTSTTTTSSRGGHYDTDADAALAASLAAQDEEAHEIRAPDATRTMRLMEDGSSSFHPALLAAADPSIRMMHEMMMMPQPQDHHHHRPSAFADSPIVTNRRSARQALDAAMAAAAAGETKQDNDDDDGMGEDDDGEQDYQYDDADDDDDDDVDMQQADDDDDDDERPSAATAPRLSDMFAAPHHLLYRAGGFQGARQMAKDSKRWLLVNLQRDSEFSCHALNRDVWRNDLVENLIREGFIFWQEVSTTPIRRRNQPQREARALCYMVSNTFGGSFGVSGMCVNDCLVRCLFFCVSRFLIVSFVFLFVPYHRHHHSIHRTMPRWRVRNLSNAIMCKPFRTFP